ncbi:N-acyl homoserine lactonase family protein [Halobacteriales archaeon Cl-PHB]
MPSDATAAGLYRFNTADWTMDHSLMVQMQGFGEPYDAPCPFYLVEHPEGTVAFDTGVSRELFQDPANYGPEGAPHMADFKEGVDIGPENEPAALLDQVGYEPGDVDVVVMSHLHTDHAGNLDAFPNAEIVVQQAELDYARDPVAPAQGLFYLGGDLVALDDADVTTIEGSYDVFGDGSITTIPTPGHSPGHQSLRVELPESGTIIVGADIANLRDGYEAGFMPAFTWSLDDAVRSVQKIQEEAQAADADVIIHHDRDDQARLPDPPAKLE